MSADGERNNGTSAEDQTWPTAKQVAELKRQVELIDDEQRAARDEARETRKEVRECTSSNRELSDNVRAMLTAFGTMNTTAQAAITQTEAARNAMNARGFTRFDVYALLALAAAGVGALIYMAAHTGGSV